LFILIILGEEYKLWSYFTQLPPQYMPAVLKYAMAASSLIQTTVQNRSVISHLALGGYCWYCRTFN
jgi:hypothetical protein